MASVVLWRSAVVASAAKCTYPRQTLNSSVWVSATAFLGPKQCIIPSTTTTTTTRTFFDFSPKPDQRIRGILTNPDSLGSRIQPGNVIDKFFKRANKVRTVPVELAHGYFWMLKDLRTILGKPTLSNPHLIPAETAQRFPKLLSGVTTLAGESVELPEFFSRKNRSRDEHAQCTLVAIDCRNYGFQSVKSWTEPFQQAFQGQARVEVINMHITEGWFSAGIMGPLIARLTKNNTPVEQHETTLICQRRDLEDFRDALRIHNVMCGYVFLLDGIGRIRFAGSGKASPEEIEKLIQFATELTTMTTNQGRTATDRSSNHGKTKRKAKTRLTQ